MWGSSASILVGFTLNQSGGQDSWLKMKLISGGLLLLFYVSISLFGLYKLKSASFGLNLGFLVGLAAYAFGFGIWLVLLRSLPLSVAFPIAAGAIAVGTQVVGWIFLKEFISIQGIVGVLLVCAGIILLTARRVV